MPQREILPLNLPHVVAHNTSLLEKYYSNKKKIYKNIINANFTVEQNKDTRHIPPPLIIPLAYISINE